MLEGLARLSFTQEQPGVRIIIVENETDGPARDVCRAMEEACPFPIQFGVEPQRGIPFARNAALRLAGPEPEWIAFIDDDEVPEPQWLDELFRVQRTFAAEVVAGPVVPRYEDGAPEWIRNGGLHLRRRLPTGTPAVPMGTGNVLFRRRLIDDWEMPFDARYALTGGSDADFFRRLAAAGAKCVWADDAVVHEWVPESRATARWVLKRAFRSGINFTRTNFKTGAAWRAGKAVAWNAACYAGWGVLGLPLALIRGRAATVRQLKHVCHGCGMLAGLLGYRHQEYRTIHGR